MQHGTLDVVISPSMYFTPSEIDWLPDILVYPQSNPLQFLCKCKSSFWVPGSIGKNVHSEVYSRYYTNPITIFGVDIGSFINKVLHYFETTTFCCHV